MRREAPRAAPASSVAIKRPWATIDPGDDSLGCERSGYAPRQEECRPSSSCPMRIERQRPMPASFRMTMLATTVAGDTHTLAS